MNAVQRFKKGKKVRIILPDGSTAEERGVGNFIQLKGEDFWRRVNSDGTLTRIGDGKNGTYPVPISVRNDLARRQQQRDTNTGAVRKQVIKHALRSTEGDANASKFSAVLNFMLPGTYTGVFSDGYGGINNYQTSMFNKSAWGYGRNLVDVYSTGDPKYMEDSDIGVGRYKGTQFEKLPAYKGNFYGTQIYLPESQKEAFIKNSGSSFSLNKDRYVKQLGNRLYGGTDDVKNHYITIEYNNNTPSVLFEDVWDLDTNLDKEAFPFILNQRVPVQFVKDNDSRLYGPSGVIHLGFDQYFHK